MATNHRPADLGFRSTSARAPCPGEATLRRFNLGLLPPAELDRVAEHLGQCPACAAALATTDGAEDDLVNGLRLSALTQVLPAEPAASPPPAIPGYAIEGELGRGGMGVVYKARHERLDRIVALKVFAPGSHFPDGGERFRQEARALARLQHPGIVQVFDAGQHGDHLYLALEFCPGGTLADQLAGQPVPARKAAALAADLARAVQAAHDRQILHRDLKPANVLLAADGRLKVTDFGLAKRLDAAADGLTRSGTIAGTPSYMAPEQVQMGRPADRPALGPAVDVWAVGAILYELLTGRVPFLASGILTTLRLVAEVEPVPPRKLIPTVPRDLETICLKCLEKAPGRRYPSAADLAADLDRFLRGEPVRARPLGPVGRAGRWARRRPAVAALAAALALVTAAAAVGVTAALLYALAGWGQAEQRTAEAVGARQHAAAQQERAERELYFSLIAQAELRWRANSAAAADALLGRCDPARRGWEWGYLHRLIHAYDARAGQGGSGGAWHPDSGWVRAAAFTPDGRHFVTAGGGNPFADQTEAAGRSRLLVWDAATGRLDRALPPVGGEIRHLALAPDGRTAAVGLRWGGVRRWSLATGQAEGGATARGCVAALGHAADGRLLALTYAELTEPPARQPRVDLRLWDAGADRVLWSQTFPNAVLDAATFGPEGRRLAVGLAGAGGPSRVLVLDPATGATAAEVPTAERPTSLAFTPAADRLAVGTAHSLVVWEVAGRRVAWQTVPPAAPLCLAYGAGGDVLAAGLADRSAQLWDGPTGRPRGAWRGHAGRVGCLAFHPEGRRFVAGTEQPGEWSLWDLARPQECLLQWEHPFGALSAEGLGFAPGGTELLIAVPTRPLTRLDPLTGRRTAVTAEPLNVTGSSPAALFAVTPDGRRVAGPATELGVVRVWDGATGEAVATLTGLQGLVRRVALSGDGRRVAAVATRPGSAGQAIREARAWDVATGRVLWAETAGSPNPHPALALSPDGALLALDAPAAPGMVRVVAVDGGRELWARPGHRALVWGLAFDAQGRRLASGDLGGAVLLHAAATGAPLTAAPLSGPGLALAFSPDGRRLAGADREAVRLWDPATGQPVLDLGGLPPRDHDDGFNPHLAWSPDGRSLAALRHVGHIAVWQAPWTGRAAEGPPPL